MSGDSVSYLRGLLRAARRLRRRRGPRPRCRRASARYAGAPRRPPGLLRRDQSLKALVRQPWRRHSRRSEPGLGGYRLHDRRPYMLEVKPSCARPRQARPAADRTGPAMAVMTRSVNSRACTLRSSGLAVGLGGCKGVPMRTPTRRQEWSSPRRAPTSPSTTSMMPTGPSRPARPWKPRAGAPSSSSATSATRARWRRCSTRPNRAWEGWTSS